MPRQGMGFKIRWAGMGSGTGCEKRFLIRVLRDVAWGPIMETGVSDPRLQKKKTPWRARRAGVRVDYFFC